MAKKIGFCVIKIGWEYNDENYYRADSGGGNPVKVFSTREKAKAECDRWNAKSGGVKNDEWDAETRKYTTVILPTYEVVEVELE